MGIADDLQKLEQLRQSGSLNDDEFQRAKSILLTSPVSSPTVHAAPFIEEQLAQVRYQNELARIDREWEIERDRFRIVGRHGRTYFPTIGMGIGTAVAGGFFGIFWTIVAVSVGSQFPTETPFSIVRTVFPLMGVVFTIAVVGRGISCCLRAHQYNEAYHAYKEMRSRTPSPEEFDQTASRNTFTQTG